MPNQSMSIAVFLTAGLQIAASESNRVEFEMPQNESRLSEATIRAHVPGIPPSWSLNNSCFDTNGAGETTARFEFAPASGGEASAKLILVSCHSDADSPKRNAECSIARERSRLVWQKTRFVRVVDEADGRDLRQLMDELERLFKTRYVVGAPQFLKIEIRENEIEMEWGDCFCPQIEFARFKDDGHSLEFLDKRDKGSCFSS
ncbi:MAG: hypothetical protein U0900_24210 [Myxococcota bacterium]